MIHDLDITKWPNATFAKWLALVDQTPGLDWHCKVIDPIKVAACRSKLALSSHSSITKAKVES
jgi:ABC-type cobalamin/Fe3+-siderophores transport system ATPase subunit